MPDARNCMNVVNKCEGTKEQYFSSPILVAFLFVKDPIRMKWKLQLKSGLFYCYMVGIYLERTNFEEFRETKNWGRNIKLAFC